VPTPAKRPHLAELHEHGRCPGFGRAPSRFERWGAPDLRACSRTPHPPNGTAFGTAPHRPGSTRRRQLRARGASLRGRGAARGAHRDRRQPGDAHRSHRRPRGLAVDSAALDPRRHALVRHTKFEIGSRSREEIMPSALATASGALREGLPPPAAAHPPVERLQATPRHALPRYSRMDLSIDGNSTRCSANQLAPAAAARSRAVRLL
jgi:hypothetical protein